MDGEDGLSSGEQPCDPRLHAPATQRNREPILDVLSRVLPGSGIVLELASGTGEHAIWLAQHLRPLVWQPSDADPDMRRSIDAHARLAGARNIRPALAIDVTSRPWPIEFASAAVCVNLLHISPWTATEGMFAGCAEILPAGAPIAIYGPFKRHGQHTAESNARFDSSLRASDSSWGVRDVDDVSTVAERHGFVLEEIVEMPANNLILVFRRQG
ncbi:DUF938 domain-containing protein [Ferruginivarius sediminum]|uniref:DUF938 domain-containing protein n=2 Tax=Ferruginivarius sediminum TaxID=2661937 RepID=A0A369TAH6_9PROT|nr:DUF938 domain-containing protein [Ferruginivarius sediminum]